MDAPAHLREFADLSARLADAADRQAWDELSELAPGYLALSDRLLAGAVDASSEPADAELLRRLLSEHQAIRDNVEPWLASTRKLLAAWSRKSAADRDP